MITDASSIVDVSFPLLASSTIPSDSGYAVFGALSHLMADMHTQHQVAIHPIAGRHVGHRQLQLCTWSDLRLRIHFEQLPKWITLAGRRIDVEGTAIRLGVPRLVPLTASDAITCRIVTIKGYMEESSFREAIRRQLDALRVSADVCVDVRKRRTVRIKDKQVVGFGLNIFNLAPAESLTVQVHGVGGRRHMGCGVFRPMRAPRRHFNKGYGEKCHKDD